MNDVLGRSRVTDLCASLRLALVNLERATAYGQDAGGSLSSGTWTKRESPAAGRRDRPLELRKSYVEATAKTTDTEKEAEHFDFREWKLSLCKERSLWFRTAAVLLIKIQRTAEDVRSMLLS